MVYVKQMSDERIKAKISEYADKLEYFMEAGGNQDEIKRATRNYNRYWNELYKRENCVAGHDLEFVAESPVYNNWSGDLMHIQQVYKCKKCGVYENERRAATRSDNLPERIEIND